MAAGRCQARQKQDAELFHGHGVVVEKQVGQGADAGEGGEKEHDERPFDAAGA